MGNSRATTSVRSLIRTGFFFLNSCLLGTSAAPQQDFASAPTYSNWSTAENWTALATYAIPPGIPTRGTFSTQVRLVSGGDWQNVSAYEIDLTEINVTTGGKNLHKSSVATFDFDRPVEIQVKYSAGTIDNARIRPESYNIVPTVSGDILHFTLDKPRNLVIQINGDIFDCLHLFTNSIPVNPPTSNSTNVLYYGPGLHTAHGNAINVTDGQTLYLAGGAVLRASVNFYNVSSAALRGHGILGNPGGGIRIERSSNIVVEDVILLNPGDAVEPAVSDHVTIRGIRSLSSRTYGDGLDVFCSKNVLIENVFMRTSDDCIAIYNHRWDYYGDNYNITVKDSSLWADVAHPIVVGTHGNPVNPETSDLITFQNIDILDHRENQVLYQGCIALNAGDSNLLSNIVAEDIRVEDFRQGQLVNFRVMFNDKYNTSPGRGIQNVTIRNLSYNGTNANMAIMSGYNETRTIEHVTFENLTINGKVISDDMQKPSWFLTSDFVPMYANEHVKNLTFSS